MPLNVYIASITGNTEIRKQVQKTLMILDGLRIPFNAIDITVRGNEEKKNFMQEKAINARSSGVPLPPQFFDGDEYLGNFTDFEEAVEDNTLPAFLRLTDNAGSSEAKESGEKADQEDEDGEIDEGEYDEDEEEEGDGEGEEEDEKGDVDKIESGKTTNNDSEGKEGYEESKKVVAGDTDDALQENEKVISAGSAAPNDSEEDVEEVDIEDDETE